MKRYEQLIYAIARRALRDPRDVEDACQDISLALWSSAGRHDPAAADEAAFVTTVARRRIIDRQRAAIARLKHVTEISDATVASALDSYVDAHAALAALARLGEQPRQVVLLSALHGCTHEEIAAELRLPLGTVKSHYARGVRRVKRQLQKVVSSPGPVAQHHGKR